MKRTVIVGLTALLLGSTALVGAQSADPDVGHVEVRQGETVAQVASRIGVTATQLRVANGLGATATPAAGRILHYDRTEVTIPTTTTVAATTTTNPATTTTAPATTTTTAPSTTQAPTTTTVAATTTTTMPANCPVPMGTPVGAIPPAMPMLCDTLAAGIPATFAEGDNSWVDDFEHGASMATIGDGYVTFERASLSSTSRTGTFRHNQHWMTDAWAPNGGIGGTMLRPDRSFRFEAGKLVVETDVAAAISGYGGFAWPELTVTTASSPAQSARGRYGPTPARSIGDDLYAYGQFGGYDSVGIRLHGERPIMARYDTTERGFPCGRVWEFSWFQDGSTNSCDPTRLTTIFGGGEWAAPFPSCTNQDPDINCRNRFRWELTDTAITLYVNGRRYMQHTALPGVHLLPEAFFTDPVYVYFSGWIYGADGNYRDRVVRTHWDRVAVNP